MRDRRFRDVPPPNGLPFAENTRCSHSFVSSEDFLGQSPGQVLNGHPPPVLLGQDVQLDRPLIGKCLGMHRHRLGSGTDRTRRDSAPFKEVIPRIARVHARFSPTMSKAVDIRSLTVMPIGSGSSVRGVRQTQMSP